MLPPPLVLLAESDTDDRGLYQVCFGLSGLRAAEASDGTRALELARQLEPDLLITDLVLPDLDAFDLVEQLRQQAATERTAVIVLAGRLTPRLVERAERAGIERVLPKPCSVEVLLAEAQHVLAVAYELRAQSPELRGQGECLRARSAELQENSEALWKRIGAFPPELRRPPGSTAARYTRRRDRSDLQ